MPIKTRRKWSQCSQRSILLAVCMTALPWAGGTVCYQCLNWKDTISTSSCHKIWGSHSSTAEHQVFWYVTLCCWFRGFCVSKVTLPPSAMVMQSMKPGLLDPQDEGTAILWNTGNHTINGTTAYLRRPESSENFVPRFKIVFITSLHFHLNCRASRSNMLRTGTEQYDKQRQHMATFQF